MAHEHHEHHEHHERHEHDQSLEHRESHEGHEHAERPDAHEHRVDRVHEEDLVLNIGGDIGALILYAGPAYREREIEVSLVGHDDNRVHTAIHERRLNGRVLYAGVYHELTAGDYRIWTDDPALPDRVTIRGGEVTELDWSRPAE